MSTLSVLIFIGGLAAIIYLGYRFGKL